jgi:hypothetical protein
MSPAERITIDDLEYEVRRLTKTSRAPDRSNKRQPRHYARTALVNASAAHWLMLFPLTCAAAATAAWTSGDTRSMSLPE